MEEDTERVHTDHVEVGSTLKTDLVEARRQRRERADKGEDPQRAPALVRGDERIDEHHDDADDAQDELGQDAYGLKFVTQHSLSFRRPFAIAYSVPLHSL